MGIEKILINAASRAMGMGKYLGKSSNGLRTFQKVKKSGEVVTRSYKGVKLHKKVTQNIKDGASMPGAIANYTEVLNKSTGKRLAIEHNQFFKDHLFKDFYDTKHFGRILKKEYDIASGKRLSLKEISWTDDYLKKYIQNDAGILTSTKDLSTGITNKTLKLNANNNILNRTFLSDGTSYKG